MRAKVFRLSTVLAHFRSAKPKTRRRGEGGSQWKCKWIFLCSYSFAPLATWMMIDWLCSRVASSAQPLWVAPPTLRAPSAAPTAEPLITSASGGEWRGDFVCMAIWRQNILAATQTAVAAPHHMCTASSQSNASCLVGWLQGQRKGTQTQCSMLNVSHLVTRLVVGTGQQQHHHHHQHHHNVSSAITSDTAPRLPNQHMHCLCWLREDNVFAFCVARLRFLCLPLLDAMFFALLLFTLYSPITAFSEQFFKCRKVSWLPSFRLQWYCCQNQDVLFTVKLKQNVALGKIESDNF